MTKYSFINQREWTSAKGIYGIFNTVDGRKYVGSSFGQTGVKGRWASHRSALRCGTHWNTYMQKCFNKYADEGKLYFALLEECNDIVELKKREAFWIKDLRAMYNEEGWNLDIITDFGTRINSEATRNKIKLAVKDRPRKPCSEETKERISQAHLGRKHPKEQTQKRLLKIIGMSFKTKERVCTKCGAPWKCTVNNHNEVCLTCRKKERSKRYRCEHPAAVKAGKQKCYFARRAYYLQKVKARTERIKLMSAGKETKIM